MPSIIYFTDEVPGLGDHVVVRESPADVAHLLRVAARNDRPSIRVTIGGEPAHLPVRLVGPVLTVQ
jgi:hypothetical protein